MEFVVQFLTSLPCKEWLSTLSVIPVIYRVPDQGISMFRSTNNHEIPEHVPAGNSGNDFYCRIENLRL